MNRLRVLFSQHQRICSLAQSAARASSFVERGLLIGKLEELLENHLSLEEEWLYPDMALYQELRGQVEVLRLEHEDLRSLLAEVAAQHQSGADYLLGLERFISLLDDHCRMEEWDLFPDADRIMPEPAIRDIGRNIERVVREDGYAA